MAIIANLKPGLLPQSSWNSLHSQLVQAMLHLWLYTEGQVYEGRLPGEARGRIVLDLQVCSFIQITTLTGLVRYSKRSLGHKVYNFANIYCMSNTGVSLKPPLTARPSDAPQFTI